MYTDINRIMTEKGYTMGILSKSNDRVSFRIHSEGKAFDVEASDGRGVAEVQAKGFESTQGFISALSAAQSHARALGVREPMQIKMSPSLVSADVVV